MLVHFDDKKKEAKLRLNAGEVLDELQKREKECPKYVKKHFYVKLWHVPVVDKFNITQIKFKCVAKSIYISV